MNLSLKQSILYFPLMLQPGWNVRNINNNSRSAYPTSD